MSTTLCKTAVFPLLTHWRYCSLALSHRCDVMKVDESMIHSTEKRELSWCQLCRHWRHWIRHNDNLRMQLVTTNSTSRQFLIFYVRSSYCILLTIRPWHVVYLLVLSRQYWHACIHSFWYCSNFVVLRCYVWDWNIVPILPPSNIIGVN